MTGSEREPRQIIPDSGLAIAVYILYGLGFVTIISALIGVIIAHVKIGQSDPISQTHFQFQIYTFWFGLLYIVLGTVLFFVFFLGYLVLLWWFVWTIVRIIKGALLLNEGRPISNTSSWLFG